MAETKEKCFVIMPFSETTVLHTEEYWTKHFETYLKPLIEENPNLEAHRSQALRGDILRQIITDLIASRVVVADLTDLNPNVFWELGVRQSFKHGTITIAEAGTDFPFDVSGKGILTYYPKDHIRNEGFREQFKIAIQDCLDHPERPDSQVLETISGRGTMFEIIHRDEVLRRLDALISECTHNLDYINCISKSAESIQKNPEKGEIPPVRLRWAAAELLITNRYIDEDETFYKTAERVTSGLMGIAHILSEWINRLNDTAEIILTSKDDWIKNIEDFKSQINTAQEKIMKKF